MLRVATVLSAREWEARLVAAARESAAVKLVLRAYLPEEVTRRADSIDVVVAGAETSWVTPTRVAAWRRLGIRVVGVHTRADRPAVERLNAGGADLILEEDLDAEQLVREIRLLDPRSRDQSNPRGRVVTVTGVRGGPGRTEIATALAWAAAGKGEASLVDADLVGPSIAVRLGLPPRPDLADCVDIALDRDGEAPVGDGRDVQHGVHLLRSPYRALLDCCAVSRTCDGGVGQHHPANQRIPIPLKTKPQEVSDSRGANFIFGPASLSEIGLIDDKI